MADRMTTEQRHKCMSRIKSKDTKPELIVRRYLHAHGYRYRINVKRLPGTPDIVLRKYKTVIIRAYNLVSKIARKILDLLQKIKQHISLATFTAKEYLCS